MADLSHQWGADLAAGATGDLALASGTLLGRQRVLRRLLTNPGDYIWQPDYGAGLAQFVGQPADVLRIKAVIRSQLLREPAVANSPAPAIDVQSQTNGIVFVQIRYVDAPTGQAQLLSFSVGNSR